MLLAIFIFQPQLLTDMKNEVEEEFGDMLPAVAEELIRKHFTRRQSKNCFVTQLQIQFYEGRSISSEKNT